MSQSSISSFFKRKVGPDISPLDGSPPKKARATSHVVRAKTPPSVVLSERTKKWHKDDDSQTITTSPAKVANHQRFVEKLGDFERKKQRGRTDESMEAEVNSEGEQLDLENGEDEVSPSHVAALDAFRLENGPNDRSKSIAKKGSKLTPLEIQVQSIQEQNPNTILMVEVGYKYRFFGPDARIASQILGIAYFKSHSFLTASVPVHRLQVHVNRLVQAGKKVGVVRQIETAALKAVGDNRNKTFERKLCEVYSKGTYLGDNSDESPGGWILAIVENLQDVSQSPSATPKAANTDRVANPAQKSRIGVVAVRPESGEVLYEVFEDGPLRAELEKSLLFLNVLEVIVVGSLTSNTRKIVNTSNRHIEEHVCESPEEATRQVEEFYKSRYSEPEVASVLKRILKLSAEVLICLAAQIHYLAEFKLETIFTLTNFFQTFQDKLCMQLPATTIAALEIFNNVDDNAERGSLFWLLNHTRTLPGRRMLRSWLTRPLVSSVELLERQEAVAEIVDARGTPFAQMERARAMLKKLPDLEKGLSKIFYNKCTRPEVLQTLHAFQRVSHAFDPRDTFQFASPILKDGLSSLPTIAEIIDGFLGEFNHVEAAKDDKYNMFKESDTLESISDHKMGILIIESDLRDHLKDIGKILKRKVVEYVTVAGIEFLIELKNDATKLVPKEWIKVSGTKATSRFHTPLIIKLIAEREQRKELLAIECDLAYANFLKRIASHYDTLRWIASTVATLDCLLSLAIVSSDPAYVRPTFAAQDAPTTIQLTASRHPIIEKIMNDAYIPNDSTLHGDGVRGMILSGPNMGGKSSYIKQVALICIMAQVGCFVPCDAAHLSILDGVWCRMGASDNMLTRESTFMVELHETSDIMAQTTPRSLVILDELGRGTSTFDGLAIASSVLHHFLHETRCLVLFVTHYPSLDRHARDDPDLVRSWHMAYLEEKGDVTFLYKLTRGMATRSYGLNVAKLAGLPASLLDRADEQARAFEADMRRRELTSLTRKLERVISGETSDAAFLPLMEALARVPDGEST